MSGEVGAIEIQDGMQGDDATTDLTPPTAQILVSDSQLEGNLGPALSFRPSGDQIRRPKPSFEPSNLLKRARQLAAVFTVERCQTHGNQLDPNVSAGSVADEQWQAVWNRTRRGECCQVFGDDPDDDVDDDEDEDDGEDEGEDEDEDEDEDEGEQEDEDEDEDDDGDEDEDDKGLWRTTMRATRIARITRLALYCYQCFRVLAMLLDRVASVAHGAWIAFTALDSFDTASKFDTLALKKAKPRTLR